jgi:hypothetical protein
MAESESQNNRSIGLPAIAVAIWAAILIVAFLANRGSDVGQVGRLFENLGGGPLAGAGFLDRVFGAGIAVLIVGAWLAVGHIVVSFIPAAKGANQPYILELAFKMAVGAAIWSLVWFFLGIVGAYSRPVAVVALVIGQILFYLLWRKKKATNGNHEPTKTPIFDKLIAGLIAVPIVLSFIAALAPPTAKDTLLYHFAVPKAFIAQDSNAFIEGNIASYLALGTEMHSVWAMLVAGLEDRSEAEAAAGALVWMFFPLGLAAIFGWAREIDVSRRWALIAVLMVAAVPSAYHVAASAYIDLALALYVTLAIYSLTRWWRTLENGWLVLIAVFLGAALSAKMTTIVVIAAFGLIVLLRVRKAKESEPDNIVKILASGFAALVLAALIASPWYLRTWQQTDSPVFPFYLSIWPAEAPGWDVERSNLFQAMNSQYGRVTNTPADYLLAPWSVSVKAQPEDARLFDGVLGVTFLIGLPLLIFGLWKFDLPVEIKVGVGVAAVVFLFWLFSSQQLRYLLPILPMLAIGIAASGEKIAERRRPLYLAATYSIIIAAVCGLLTTFAWFLQKAPLRVVLDGENRDQYLTKNLDYYPYYQALNTTTAPDAKVWLINMRRDTYNLDRPVFSDYLFEDWTLRKMVWESRSVQELKAKAAAMGASYMLTRHDFLFDYDRSTLVDDTKSRAENEAKLKIARDFILDKANTVHADEKFSLVKLFN